MSKGTSKTLSPGVLAARELLSGYIDVSKDDGKLITMEDKLAIIDRLIKIEALEFKMTGQKSGAAFDDEDEE